MSAGMTTLPEFSGLSHEDTRAFLRQCNVRLAPTLGQLFQLQDHLLHILVEVNGRPAAALVNTGTSHVFITPSLVPPGALRPHRVELRLATTTRPGVTMGKAEIEHQATIEQVLCERQGVFATAIPLRRSTVVEHQIPTTHDRPIHQPPRGYGFREQHAIREQVSEMLQDGIIELSSSHYNSCVVSHKKDGSLRFCVDFGPLNTITISAPPFRSVSRPP
ncbi:uncharacterized protein LOC134527587 [Bacillus rossius redtenbacheri]|uniref:uncharacterized protein LOC134527587 n=1 Tax=Bacillus rossius redtenbacheri TaxID=93214 RepID=UPI002FDEDBCE